MLVAPRLGMIKQLLEYKSHGAGRPPWEPTLMLAKWFDLSDPGLEESLLDRISFRKFVGLSFTDATPDEATFVKFRKRLREAKLDDYFFQSVVKHLDSKGFLVREGTMVDATIIHQSTDSKNDDGENTRDQDASFTKKHGKAHHGYKAHIACDMSGVITDYQVTTAKVHDSGCPVHAKHVQVLGVYLGYVKIHAGAEDATCMAPGLLRPSSAKEVFVVGRPSLPFGSKEGTEEKAGIRLSPRGGRRIGGGGCLKTSFAEEGRRRAPGWVCGQLSETMV